MVTIFHSLASLSFPQVEYLLATLRVVLFGAFTVGFVGHTVTRGNLTLEQAAMLRDIPLDIRSVMNQLGVVPEVTEYACCPDCFAIYLPESSNPDDPYPHYCTHQEADQLVCGALLVKRRSFTPKERSGAPLSVFRALRLYPYRSLKQWIVELLSRPGIRETLRNSWLRKSSTKCEDIMQSPAIQEFTGPDGTTLFSVQVDGSIHLVFSLFIDWFNPYGNKKAGKSHSIGAIYMACLNLPPHLRYRPENIFLAGVIPGPREPTVYEINSLLAPLIDELLELWDPGLYVEKTATERGGLVRAAIIPLVCDLPAVRKAAGVGGHSSTYFCSFCMLPHKDICNLDRSQWPRAKSWAEHLRWACAWRDASTMAERTAIFKQHGIRWSELHRLPYWDFTRYAVLDVMHNIFLGELRHHCREVWNLGGGGGGSPGANSSWHTPEEQEAQLRRVRTAIGSRAEQTLANMRKDYLSAVACYNRVIGSTSADPTRREYANALLEWVSRNGAMQTRLAHVSQQVEANGIDRLELPPAMPEATKQYRLPYDEPPKPPHFRPSKDDLRQIQEDIDKTIIPSWLEKVPSSFGEAKHGKLKADHWRTVCTVNLVITLVRRWGTASSTDEEIDALKNYIHLVVAADFASRRSMTFARAAAYEYHMEQYLRGLVGIYHRILVPNQHLALHLRRFLDAFGPVHGWWTFPFERYNGLLQRLKTNFKPGELANSGLSTRLIVCLAEMPMTFMRYWYIGSALRWIIRTIQWPAIDEYDLMLRTFEKAFSDTVRGTRVTDILSSGGDIHEPIFAYDRRAETPLTPYAYHALLHLVNVSSSTPFQSAHNPTNNGTPRLHPAGQFVSFIHRRGIRFATREKGLRDSFINFRSADGQVRAGQIVDIFYHHRSEQERAITQPFLIVEAYSPLIQAHTVSDPFSKFPELDTRLYYDKFEATPYIIGADDIVSHFATFKYHPDAIGEVCVVARSLDRVRNPSSQYTV